MRSLELVALGVCFGACVFALALGAARGYESRRDHYGDTSSHRPWWLG